MSLFDEIRIENWPEFSKLVQEFDDNSINMEDELKSQLNRIEKSGLIKNGNKIAVAVGSRGITSISSIVKMVIDKLLYLGADPFIVPAMGSHGGANKIGQLDVLESLGITEKFMGVKIHAGMDAGLVGRTEEGLSVYFSEEALKADGIVLINRIKKHTNFRGEYESGLLKMLVVGLGKHKGALTMHSLGFNNLANNLLNIGEYLLDKMNILFGIGIVENAYERTVKIEAVEGHNILKREPELLQFSNTLQPRIPLKNIDVLVVCEMGKDISGDGMDPNIIGRYSSDLKADYSCTPHIKSIAVLDLTSKSHGSAIGVGYADVTTKRLFDKFNHLATYANGVTAMAPAACKIPIIMPDDRKAIETAIKISGNNNIEDIKICIIPNTLFLEEMYITKPLEDEIVKDSETSLGGYLSLKFDKNNNLMKF